MSLNKDGDYLVEMSKRQNVKVTREESSGQNNKRQDNGGREEVRGKSTDRPVPFKEETRQDQIIIVAALAISLIIVTAIFWFEITTILK